MSTVVAANLRPGQFVIYAGELHQVTKVDLIRKGRGGSVIALGLKNAGSGRQVALSCGVDDKFAVAALEEAETEYMYDDGERIYCVDGADYACSLLDTDIVPLLGPATRQLRLISVDGTVCKISLARQAVVVIAETEPYLPLQMAVSTSKPARLANGWRVEVPAFIESGDSIVLDTEARSYVAKAE